MKQTELSRTEQTEQLDQLCVTTIRMLAVDMVEQARSGHPGMPLGAAPMAYVLFFKVMRHHGGNPDWLNRDRFILSAGHASALLYALLHLSGYALDRSDLMRFRQMGSLTPGHPEYRHTPGVEATTGPLGQGIAMAVGMALAERRLSEQFHGDSDLPPDLIDHAVYTLVSDGDLMEGISSEAASLAGHLKLGKLIALYDDNRISIEGSTEITFTENVAQRFLSYGWQVLRVEDGENCDAIEKALQSARETTESPSLIIVRTHIGYGSPKEDSPSAHGSPLGEEAMAETRRFFDWPEERFHLPEAALSRFSLLRKRGQRLEEAWQQRLEDCRVHSPKSTKKFEEQMRGDLPERWHAKLDAVDFGEKPVATRAASGIAMNALAPHLPALMGGSADLAPSNKTFLQGASVQSQNIHFGVREHAMAAIANGMALHGGFIPFVATFLVFSDYFRGALRLSALMKIPVIYVLTHDSIAVGEDGPTHQPVEHIASLRAIPGLTVVRPADAQETAEAWRMAVELKQPIALILSRQKLPLLKTPIVGSVREGASIVAEFQTNRTCGESRQIVLIATGSEVSLALAARDLLFKENDVACRVISFSSWERFEAQPISFQETIFPKQTVPRLAIEAGSSLGWHRWIGIGGDVVSVDRFGASAPGDDLMAQCGFTVENIVKRALRLI